MQPALKGREFHEGMNSMRQGPAKGLLQAACVRQIQCFIIFFFFFMISESTTLHHLYFDVSCICPNFQPSNRFSYSDMCGLSFIFYDL